MASSKSIFLCQYCGWKKVCDTDSSGLLELKSDSMSARKFRCPDCGRAVTPRRFPDPQAEADRKIGEERMRREAEAFAKEAIDFQSKFTEDADG